MREKILFYIRLLRKKCRDTKLKTKIQCSLLFIAISTVVSIAFYSYEISKDELLENSRASVIALEKLAGERLDDKIDSFQDLSYQMLQSSEIVELLYFTKEEAMENKTRRDNLAVAVSKQSSLYPYIRFVLLKPNNQVVHQYYRFGEKKHRKSEEASILAELEKKVTYQSPVCWTIYKGQHYFIRKIIDERLQSLGTVCFALTDDFFQIVKDDIEYLNDDNFLVLNSHSVMLKDNAGLEQILPGELLDIRSNDYYVFYQEMELDGQTYTSVVLNTPKNNWRIIGLYSNAELLKGTERIWKAMLGILAIAAVVVWLTAWFISRSMTRNIRLIEQGMKEYEQGHFSYRICPRDCDELGYLGLQLNYMAMKINELIELVKQEQDEKQKLEFATLQAQINPHFLYNTLGSLKWLAFREGNKKLSAIIDDLIALLRFTVKKAGKMISLKEEIDYINHYIGIEKMRYGDHFQIECIVDEALEDFPVPGFVLQPIVENALLHGLDLSRDDNSIIINIKEEKDFVCIEVRDNGMGMPPEKLEKLMLPKEGRKGFNSIGVSIVDQRLHVLYGDTYCTKVSSEEGKGTSITLCIPKRREEHEL